MNEKAAAAATIKRDGTRTFVVQQQIRYSSSCFLWLPFLFMSACLLCCCVFLQALRIALRNFPMPKPTTSNHNQLINAGFS